MLVKFSLIEIYNIMRQFPFSLDDTSAFCGSHLLFFFNLRAVFLLPSVRFSSCLKFRVLHGLQVFISARLLFYSRSLVCGLFPFRGVRYRNQTMLLRFLLLHLYAAGDTQQESKTTNTTIALGFTSTVVTPLYSLIQLNPP